MLHKATQLKGATVVGLDGDIGVIDDLYIDDELWGVRYLAVRTRAWPAERKILIPPDLIRRDASSDDRLRVDLRRDEVMEGPLFDLDKPLSRRQEKAFAAYYGHQPYWELPRQTQAPRPGAEPVSPSVTGTATAPATSSPAAVQVRLAQPRQDGQAADQHLYSSHELLKCTMAAQDGELGKIEDLLIDEASWTVHQLVVDTKPWLPGGEVEVPVVLARGIDRSHGALHVDAKRDAIKALPTRH